jgi:hypothetical protein
VGEAESVAEYVRWRRKGKKGMRVSQGHIKGVTQAHQHHEKVFVERAKARMKRICSWATITHGLGPGKHGTPEVTGWCRTREGGTNGKSKHREKPRTNPALPRCAPLMSSINPRLHYRNRIAHDILRSTYHRGVRLSRFC